MQTIGIDSEFCLVESLVTGIVDMWPEQLRPIRRKFTAGLCLLLFALGVPMVTQVCIGRCTSRKGHMVMC